MVPIKFALTAAFLFLLGVILRAWELALESPDYYEAIAHLILQTPASGYLSARQIDFCPPLFYLIYHPGTMAGGPIWLSRLTSVLIGSAVGPLLFLGTRRAVGAGAAFLAGLFLTLNPLHVDISQEAVPTALATALFAGALHYWYLSSTTFKPRHWLPYAGMAAALVYAHPGGVSIVATLFFVHLGAVAAYRPPDGQRRVRRMRLLGTAAYHYGLVAAVSAPWLLRMDGQVPWNVPYPKPLEALRVFAFEFNFGVFESTPLIAMIILALLLLLLVLPVIGLMTANRFFETAPLLIMLAGFAVLIGAGQLDRTRFLLTRDAPILLPAACLALGILVWRCNLVIRTALTVGICGLYLVCSVVHLRSAERLPWKEITSAAAQHAGDDGLVIFWPDFTQAFGTYFLGQSKQTASATEVFETWAELPTGKSAAFVLSDWPMRTDHLYTFPGALSRFARTSRVWQDGRNTVIKAADINWSGLKLWYAAPETLRIVDQPTSNTQFLFTPGKPVFRDREQFLRDVPALCYDEDGRQVVWTLGEHTDASLDVSLVPGSYILRLHCSPAIDQHGADSGEPPRRVSVVVRSGEERARADIDRATTIELPFSTDVETRAVPLHISVTPTRKVRTPVRAELGIKIYSISIEQEFAAMEPGGI